MTKFIGFYGKSGEFTAESGEVIQWSNRYLWCITDEDMLKGEYGLKVVEQKMKTADVCKSLCISENSSEEQVDKALSEVLNKEIIVTVGLSKGKFEVNGFKVVGK